MNNIVVDIGNSFAKLALVDSHSGRIISQSVWPTINAESLEEFARQCGPVSGAILSSTRNLSPEFESAVRNLSDNYIFFLSGVTPVPIKNGYATPMTLGADRLAAAIGAWRIASAEGGEMLIIDMGSAITIDRVNSSGVYLGGNISPGMAMRYEALHRLTDRLPLCIAPDEQDGQQITANSTRRAIEHGVAQGILFELEGYIAAIEKQITPTEEQKKAKKSLLHIFFTGRDAKYFAGKIKKPIFVVSDLVIHGLNHILEYNTIQR